MQKADKSDHVTVETSFAAQPKARAAASKQEEAEERLRQGCSPLGWAAMSGRSTQSPHDPCTTLCIVSVIITTMSSC